MDRRERTWPTAVLAIGVGAFIGWAVMGPSSFSITLPLSRAPAPPPPPIALERNPPPSPSVRLPRRVSGASRVVGTPEELWAVRRSGEHAVATADELLDMLRTDAEPRRRRLAAAALASADSPEAVAGALMIAAASDPDPTVRATAAQSLGRLGTPAVVPALITVLHGDGDVAVRVAAVTAVAEIGGPLALDLLVGALSDPSEHVRAQSALLLGRSGLEGARAPLEHTLREDTSRLVRRAARAALARLELGGR